jgi:hypothetical protein
MADKDSSALGELFQNIVTTKLLVVHRRNTRRQKRNLWAEAALLISKADRDCLEFEVQDAERIPSQILATIEERVEEGRRRQWRFHKRDGSEVVLREIFVKIVKWINKFKALGDLTIQYDPVHAALPWAAIRFFLQVCPSGSLRSHLLTLIY